MSEPTAHTAAQARRRIAAPTAAMLPRIGDSLSFLYLDMMRIVQDDTGVLAFPAKPAPSRRIRIPTAALSCLLLGPGTSITAPAMTTLARHGTSVLCVGSGAVRCYAGITPPGQNSRWLEAQAAAWADPAQRLQVAVRMYEQRFDARVPPGTSVAQLRGMEGQRVKSLYRQLAQQHGLAPFKRSYDPQDWDAQDPVNLALSAGNVCLYGIAHAAIIALGCSPGLGFVHTGMTHSFVYDIADLYKARITVPLAFSLHGSRDVAGTIRRALRRQLTLFRLLPRIVGDIQQLLDPQHAPADARPDTPDVEPAALVHLWDPQLGPVDGGTNYAADEDDSGAPWRP